MFALVLTGPPGSGKSEVAASLHDSLADRGVDAALVEIDALERSHPPLDRDRAISHLRMIASSYRDVGAELLLITATLEDDAYREAVDCRPLEIEAHLLIRLRGRSRDPAGATAGARAAGLGWPSRPAQRITAVGG